MKYLIILFSFLGFGHRIAAQVLFSATPISATVSNKTSQSETASVIIVYNVKNTNNPTTGGAYTCGIDYELQPTGSKLVIRSGSSATGTI